MTHLDPRVVPADDRGFLLGDGLFETVRLYEGRPFRLEAHLRRLEGGADRLGMPLPGDLADRVGASIEAWDGTDGALRITCTSGTGAGLERPRDEPSRIAVQIRPWRASPEWWSRGLRAHTAGTVSAGALTSGLKCLGYVERIQALAVARDRGGDEAILRNEHGELVEGSASNLLTVEKETIVAPGPAQGALPGITRGIVLEILKEAGYRVEERGVLPGSVGRADEVLLTSSLREVVPVVALDEAPVGSGRPGPVFRTAIEGLRALVAAELGLALEPGPG